MDPKRMSSVPRPMAARIGDGPKPKQPESPSIIDTAITAIAMRLRVLAMVLVSGKSGNIVAASLVRDGPIPGLQRHPARPPTESLPRVRLRSAATGAKARAIGLILASLFRQRLKSFAGERE
ncbi:hypothetical protein MTE01_25540 [Microbacterium testaceum]|uniref:Uncharacterized protein n=1 Tax=Microbacterium testaceum TaxID=2033 RepID=A0A4Y3QNS1_MICTE|nr:hypothetical protein MTE01_25540 [Microbacterium testaceum]